MEQLIEILDQIKELAGVAGDAVKDAVGGGKGKPKPGDDQGGPPSGPPDDNGPPPPGDGKPSEAGAPPKY